MTCPDPDAPVFLLGSHKSGTSLLRNLLDGTPGFFVVPMEAHFFQFMGYWVDYPFRRTMPKKLSFDEMVENLAGHIRLSNQSAARTSDSCLKGQWDVEGFVKFLGSTGFAAYQVDGIKGLMTAYVQAIYLSLYGRKMPDLCFVEKSVENAEYGMVLNKLWPEARFVHIVRNPYATLAATRRYTAAKGYPFLARHLAVLKNSYYYLYKNPLCIDRYLVIRYEDLVVSPEKTMAQVAAFLDIPFDGHLLEPSVMGVPWKGNSTVHEKFSGISTAPLDMWKTDIHSLEITFVNRFFSHILADFGYNVMDAAGSVYHPCPKESLKMYAANRLLLKLADRVL